MKYRILVSYYSYKNTDFDDWVDQGGDVLQHDFFADSGAFSAQTQGVSISLTQYAEWVTQWAHRFTVYANLDVIGDPAATQENQIRLEALGLHPLPVFHVGSPWKYLAKLIDRYPYIALGGMVPHLGKFNKIIPWLVKAFRMSSGRAVFHGFGAGNMPVIGAFPWYSVDSSSWSAGVRWGLVPVFDPVTGVMVSLKLGDVRAWRKNGALVQSYGFDIMDFADRRRNSRIKIAALSLLSMRAAEQWARRKWGVSFIPNASYLGGGLRIYDASHIGFKEQVKVALLLEDKNEGDSRR